MKYNALCILSDGVNSKVGSSFAPYEFFYAWRKVTSNEEVGLDGIDSLHTLLEGLFDKARLLEVIRHFIYFPDVSKAEVKIVCRYPQFYAATKLYDNIKRHRKPEGDGKDYRKELDRQFKNGKSNFKIAIIVDMWLTGFDVPFLDTI